MKVMWSGISDAKAFNRLFKSSSSTCDVPPVAEQKMGELPGLLNSVDMINVCCSSVQAGWEFNKSEINSASVMLASRAFVFVNGMLMVSVSPLK